MAKPAKKATSAVAAKKTAAKAQAIAVQAKKYLSQEDVPSYGLNDALKIGNALVDQYGGRAATPLDVAAALNVQPGSGSFRMLCGASIAYGITIGGYNAQEISLTPIGNRILVPLVEGDDLVARREAVLKPRVLREFLSKYSGSGLPRDDIALNVLKSMGVPDNKAEAVLQLIIESAQEVGFLRKIKEKTYVDLGGTPQAPTDSNVKGKPLEEEQYEHEADQKAVNSIVQSIVVPMDVESAPVNRRVFITHGKNMAFIEPIKKLLGFGELVPVVSVEKQSVSQPVPDKVMNDMRTCSAAIIHVDSEQTLIDKDAKEHSVINPNVLIEIGAAMALFGRRFILLVREGVKLPSNLQGLYEVRYQGDALDGNATIRLLEAINDIKNNPLPVSTHLNT
jgi:predicted nucleotide-binding protein